MGRGMARAGGMDKVHDPEADSYDDATTDDRDIRTEIPVIPENHEQRGAGADDLLGGLRQDPLVRGVSDIGSTASAHYQTVWTGVGVFLILWFLWRRFSVKNRVLTAVDSAAARLSGSGPDMPDAERQALLEQRRRQLVEDQQKKLDAAARATAERQKAQDESRRLRKLGLEPDEKKLSKAQKGPDDDANSHFLATNKSTNPYRRTGANLLAGETSVGGSGGRFRPSSRRPGGCGPSG